jgi:hypothetical protein
MSVLIVGKGVGGTAFFAGVLTRIGGGSEQLRRDTLVGLLEAFSHVVSSLRVTAIENPFEPDRAILRMGRGSNRRSRLTVSASQHHWCER